RDGPEDRRRGLPGGPRGPRRRGQRRQRPERAQAEVPAADPDRSDDELAGLGQAVVPGQARCDVVGRAERVRRLHEVGGDGARRHEIPRLVMAMTTILRRRRQAGFTLIELLVVISLISILAAMAVVQYRNSIDRTKEA